jgi:hypothetical protein
MARIPTVTTVDQQPAGVIPGQFQGRNENAPIDFGQGAARLMGQAAGAVQQALSGFGEQMQRAGGALAEQAIRDQELNNETEATEKATAMQATFNERWEAFSKLEGRDATAAYEGFRNQIKADAEGTLAEASNERVRRMLAGRVGHASNAMLASAAQRNTQQSRVASIEASEAASQQAVAGGMLARYNPAGLATALAIGQSEIVKIGEIAGWDAVTLQQKQAEYRGRFYGSIIATMADEDALAAERFFNSVKESLDAGAQIRIANSLEAPVIRARAAEINAIVRAPTQTENPNSVRDVIFRVENPAGDARKNPNSSASGPGQITRNTWNAYADRLGFAKDVAGRPAPPNRNSREAQEAIFEAYQSDARAAVGRPLTTGEQYAAWVLGVSGVKAFIEAAPNTDARALYAQVAGEATAKSAFANNGALMRPGMTTGQVLQALSARVTPTTARGDSGALLRRAVEMAGNDPRLQAAVISQFNMMESVQNATQAQDRAALDRQVSDIGKALNQGAQVSIPEAEIRRLMPPEQADRTLDALYTMQIAGQVFSSVQLAAPQELQALRQDIIEGSGPVTDMLRLRRGTRMDAAGVVEADRAGDVASRGELREVLDKRIEERNRQLFADPAQYVLADPVVRERAGAAANDSQELGGYVTATLAAQARLGVAEPDRRILSKAQSQAIASDIMRSDPAQGDPQNPDGPALRLKSLRQTYGEAWPRVFQDLVRDGNLPPEYQILANIDNAVGQADFSRMLAAQKAAGGAGPFREGVRRAFPTEESRLAKEVGAYVQPFVATALASGQTGGDRLAAMVGGAIENLAAYYIFRGADATTAMQRAADRVVNDKYDILGTMRVPKETSDGRPLGLRPVQQAQSFVMRNLNPEQLVDLEGAPGVPLDENRNIAWRASQRGFWVPNENDTGLVLMRELNNGGRVPVHVIENTPNSVRDRNGMWRIELTFNSLPTPTLSGVGAPQRDSPARAVTPIQGYDVPAPPENRRGPGFTPQQTPPPVTPVMPGERRGARGSQPRGSWVPPQ